MPDDSRMTPPDLSVDLLDRFADVPAGLWPACFPAHLEGEWWYRCLETSGLDDQFRFFYAVVRSGDRPVALAPLFLMNVPIDLVLPEGLLPLFRLLGRVAPGLRYQRTLFVGSPCADEGTVGVLPGVARRPVLERLADAVTAKARAVGAPMVVWKDFRDSDRPDLDWLAVRAGLFPMASFPGTEASLPATGGKQAYFAAMKGSRRQQLRKKLRRSHEAVALDVSVERHPPPAVMDEIFGLFWQTYEKATTKFERLNRRMFDQLAAEPVSRFVLLREQGGGAIIAFMLCFVLDGRMINKFIGIDYHRPRDWMLYFRLWEAALDWALAEGFSSIQSGQTGYAPKIEMGHSLVPLTNYCRHANPLIHWIYARVARTIGWATLDPDLARFLAAHPECAPGAIVPPSGAGPAD